MLGSTLLCIKENQESKNYSLCVIKGYPKVEWGQGGGQGWKMSVCVKFPTILTCIFVNGKS